MCTKITLNKFVQVAALWKVKLSMYIAYSFPVFNVILYEVILVSLSLGIYTTLKSAKEPLGYFFSPNLFPV